MIRFYRILLRLYPASFRAEYGDEMTAVFAEASTTATPLGKLGLILRTTADEVVNALAVQWAILIQDLRYTFRSISRSRGFALTAILVTALGVGANTAAFSVADFVLLRPLPFDDPETLVRLCEGPRTGGGWGCNNQLSPANYRDFKSMSSSFQALGAFANDAVNLVGGGEPRRLAIARVTPEVLPLLGVPPVLGRAFHAEGNDDDPAAILSHGLWQSQFGGDPGVLGRMITLNGAPYVVIGVMPPSFHFPTREVQLWTPLTFREEDLANRNNSYIEAVGRLASGVTFEQARAELQSAADRLAREYPTNTETGISFFRMRDSMAPRFRLMLLALAGASLCLLLLTCANLANLLLVRATARGREFAVRAALGAGKERLVRQLITESIVLSLLGGTAGVLVASLGVPLFSSLIPPTLPVDSQPSLDFRVLGVAALFSALTGLGFGLFPALRAGGRTGSAALRESSRAGGGAKQRLRDVLVTVEITMSVILLITSGLLIRAVWRVQAVEPGFVTQDVLTLRTALPRPKYESPLRRVEFYDRVLRDVRGLPGVRSAAYVSGLPMIMTGGIARVQFPGRAMPRDGSHNNVSMRFVTTQFFSTMGIPVLQGRDLEDSDSRDRTWVAVVSESFVNRHWPDEGPIGKMFLHQDRPRIVVGVVGDVKVRGLERTSEPQMYLPAAQVADRIFPGYDPKDLLIRHTGLGTTLVPAIRQIVRAADPDQPISDIRALDEVVAGETAPRRAQLQVLGTLAIIALLLSGVGIHGLLAYTVSQRSQEIGVRLALGAERSSVARMIVSDGMRLAVLAILLGVPTAYAAARGMSALLFGVEPGDPATIAAAIGLALVMTFAGSLLPAMTALRVSPTSVMRAE